MVLKSKVDHGAFVKINASTWDKFIGNVRRSYICQHVLFKILMFAVPCDPYNIVASSITSTGVRISWKCRDPDQASEFTVMYTLNIKDQCNAPDELLSKRQRIDCMVCNRTQLGDDIYSYSLDLSGLYPYSTYAFFVQARIPGSVGSTFGGDQFTTDTAGECYATNVMNQY